MGKQSLISQRRINWGRILFIGSMTLATVVGLPIYVIHYGMSLPNIILLIFWAAFTEMAITLGYHRLFSHFSFKTNSFITFLCLFLGAATLESSAIRWVCQHRDHHAYLDREGDPYNINEGFFHAYVGWLWFREHRFNYHNVKDLIKNRLIKSQHRYYPIWVLLAGIFLPTLSGLMTNDLVGSFFLLVIARMTIVHHNTFFVNAVCHSFGKKTYNSASSARDLWPAAFITHGEAFHSFHHRFPIDYRNGVRWYHWDPTKWLIALLAYFGFAWNLKRVPQAQIEAAKRLAEKGSASRAPAHALSDSLGRA